VVISCVQGENFSPFPNTPFKQRVFLLDSPHHVVHIPTQKEEARQCPRLPDPLPHQERKQGHRPSPPERTRPHRPLMLPKASRFTREEFDLLLKGGRSRNYPFFSVRSAPGFVGRKVAVVVSKKGAPLASSRNRARRRTYAAIRPSVAFLPPRVGVAFFLRKESFTATPTALREALAEALQALSK